MGRFSISSGAKLFASSSYKDKPLLSANLAFSDGSRQGLKSPDLPQERQRIRGWEHGRREGGSFDLDYGSKTVIQTECSSTGNQAASQRPPLLKENSHSH